MTNKKIKLISCVIPNSSINKDFFNAMKKYQEFLGEDNTEIMLYTTNLKNKEAILEAETIAPYRCIGDKQINKSLRIIDVNIRHTAINPLSGFTHNEKCVIIPAPRMTYKMLPRQEKNSKLPRMCTATGTISNPENYKKTKSEIKSRDFHISNGMGFLIVESLTDKLFNWRFVEWDDKEKCFYDFPMNERVVKVTSKNVSASQALALSTGDTHIDHIDMDCWNWTKDIIANSNPQKVIFHDAFDGSSYYVNHHIQNSLLKRENQEMSIKKELDDFINFFLRETILDKKLKNRDIALVASNHHEFIDRFIEDENRLKGLTNELAISIMRGDLKKEKIVQETIEVFSELIKYKKQGLNPLKEYCIKREKRLAKMLWWERDTTEYVADKIVSDHGDKGVNGARGSVGSLAKANPKKTITGHTHTPERTPEGNSVNGHTCISNPDYCDPSGYTTWAQAHNLIYPNGAVATIFFVR